MIGLIYILNSNTAQTLPISMTFEKKEFYLAYLDWYDAMFKNNITLDVKQNNIVSLGMVKFAKFYLLFQSLVKIIDDIIMNRKIGTDPLNKISNTILQINEWPNYF